MARRQDAPIIALRRARTPLPSQTPGATSVASPGAGESGSNFAAATDAFGNEFAPTFTQGTVGISVDQFVADGEYGEDVVMVGRCAWRHRATGAEVSTPKIDVWRFEFGKATRFTEMFDSLAFARAVGAA